MFLERELGVDWVLRDRGYGGGEECNQDVFRFFLLGIVKNIIKLSRVKKKKSGKLKKMKRDWKY